MHDPSKSNFWFGRKYFYLDGANKDLCPTKLTQGSAKFVNNKGTVENDFNVECSGKLTVLLEIPAPQKRLFHVFYQVRLPPPSNPPLAVNLSPLRALSVMMMLIR